MSFSANSNGGEYKHLLTTKEIPSHTHMILTADKQNNVVTGWTDYGRVMRTGSSYDVHNLTTSAGEDNAHNNIQPYITVYFWRRTA